MGYGKRLRRMEQRENRIHGELARQDVMRQQETTRRNTEGMMMQQTMQMDRLARDTQNQFLHPGS